MIPRHGPSWITPLLLLALASLAQATSFHATVVGVSDGDTITVLSNRKMKKIRLYGIDCPEKAQDFGARAKEFTSHLVYQKKVLIHVKNTDRYGRWVGDIILSTGERLNEKLVASGHAWWIRRHAPHDRALRTLEQEARRDKRGLWAHHHPIPPWKFRETKNPINP